MSLATEFTAKELAEKLSASDARRQVVTDRLRIAADALRSIARGEWTDLGARQTARKAIEEMKQP